MLEPRGLWSSAPPEPRSPRANRPTLLFSWWCTGFATVIILMRLLGRKIRTNVLFREDWIMMLALIPLLIRMALIHVVLLYGTNNVQTSGLNEMQIAERAIGSRLVLGARIFYALLWVCLSCTLCNEADVMHQYLDFKIHRLRVSEASYRRYLAPELRNHAPLHPSIPGNNICCCCNSYAIRMPSIRPLLAGRTGPRTTLPSRIRATHHDGLLRHHYRLSSCRLSDSDCHTVFYANQAQDQPRAVIQPFSRPNRYHGYTCAGSHIP